MPGWDSDVRDEVLAVELGPLRLAHPLINASGTMEILELAETLGGEVLRRPPVAAYVPKTITLEPRGGNPGARILETAAGLVNAVGLANEGAEVFLRERLPQLLALPCPIIVSIGGFSPEEYVVLARLVRDTLTAKNWRQGVPGAGSPPTLACDRPDGAPRWVTKVGLELNISCPNVHSGCMSVGADPEETAAVVASVRAEWPGLLVAKLTPNVAEIAEVGRAAAEAGVDALAAVNTFKGLVIDRTTLRPYLGNVTGGLSGPAIKPLALRAVYELYQTVGVPLIGMGGVAELQDVLDFVACGARVVAVGSAGFREPLLAARLAKRLAEELDARGMSLTELVGCAHRTAP
jgi:dihydroorotate dehydrogenase (NAD+) catalytic subunit